VSCPNYTYEMGSWIFFTIMTQSVPCKFIIHFNKYLMQVKLGETVLSQNFSVLPQVSFLKIINNFYEAVSQNFLA